MLRQVWQAGFIVKEKQQLTLVFIKFGATEVQSAFLHHQAAAAGRPLQN